MLEEQSLWGPDLNHLLFPCVSLVTVQLSPENSHETFFVFSYFIHLLNLSFLQSFIKLKCVLMHEALTV